MEGQPSNLLNNIKSNTKKCDSLSIKTRMDYRGRDYIPIEVRKSLQLKPNDEVNLKCESNTIILFLTKKRTYPR